MLPSKSMPNPTILYKINEIDGAINSKGTFYLRYLGAEASS